MIDAAPLGPLRRLVFLCLLLAAPCAWGQGDPGLTGGADGTDGQPPEVRAAPSVDLRGAAPVRVGTPALVAVRDRLLKLPDHGRRLELLLRLLTETDNPAADAALLGDATALVRALQHRADDDYDVVEAWLRAVFVAEPGLRADVVARARGGAPLPGEEEAASVDELLLDDEAPLDGRAEYLKQAKVKEYRRRRLIFKDKTVSGIVTSYADPGWSVVTGDGFRARPRQFARLTGDADRIKRFKIEAALAAVGSGSLAGGGIGLIAAAFASQVDDSQGELLGAGPSWTPETAQTVGTVGGGLIAAALPSAGIPVALHSRMTTAYSKARAREHLGRFNDRLLRELGLDAADVDPKLRTALERRPTLAVAPAGWGLRLELAY